MRYKKDSFLLLLILLLEPKPDLAHAGTVFIDI